MTKRDVNIQFNARNRTSRAFRQINKDLRGLNRGFETARNAALGVIGAFGTISGAQAIGALFRDATASARDFEQQMATVRAVTKASAEDFALLRNAAEQAGATTTFTATEAGQALEVLSRAGFSARDSVETLAPTLALAQANAISLDEAATLTATTLRQFGLDVSDSARVADVLTAATQKSNTNVTELGQALSFVGATASAQGVSLEQLTAILGKLGDNGLQGSRAATGLRQVLSKLSQSTGKLNTVLSDAGVETRDLTEVLEILSQDTGLAEKAIQALDAEAQTAFRVMIKTAEGSRDLADGLNNVAGAAQTAADTMTDTLQGSLDILRSSFDSFRRTAISGVFDALKDDVNNLTDLLTENRDVAERLSVVFEEAFAAGRRAVRKFLAQFDLDKVVTETEEAGDAITKFLGALESIAPAAAFMSKTVGNTFEGLFEGLTAAFTTVEGFILEFVRNTVEYFRRWAQAIQDFVPGLEGAFDGFIESAKRLESVLDDRANAAMERLRRTGADLKETLDDQVDASQRLGDAYLNQAAAGDAATESAKAQTQATEESTRAAEASAEATEAAAQATTEWAQRLEDVRAGNLAYADAVAALDAALGSGRITLDEYRQKLAELEAAMTGATETTQKNTGATEDNAEAAGAAAGEQEKLAAATSKTGVAAAEAVPKLAAWEKQARATAEAMGLTAEQADRVVDANRRSGKAAEESAEGTEKQTDALADNAEQQERTASAVNQGARAQENASDKTASATRATQSQARGVANLVASWTSLGGTVGRVVDGIVTKLANNTISGFMRGFANEIARVNARYAESSRRLDELLLKVNAGQNGALRFAGALNSAAQAANLLNQQQLDQINNALAQAEAQARATAKAIREAVNATRQQAVESNDISIIEQEIARLQSLREQAIRDRDLLEARNLEAQIDQLERALRELRRSGGANGGNSGGGIDLEDELSKIERITDKRLESERRVQEARAAGFGQDVQRVTQLGDTFKSNLGNIFTRGDIDEGFIRAVARQVKEIERRSA